MAPTLESITAEVRKTEAGLVSVTDVIMAVKGCNSHHAAALYRRLRAEERVGACSEVRLCRRKSALQKSARGGCRIAEPVASAREIVQILCVLPGQIAVRRRCAVICLIHMQGDPALVGNVFRNAPRAVIPAKLAS